MPMAFLQKYSMLLIGFGLFIIGMFAYLRVWDDVSRNAGMVQMVVGSISIGYYFFRRK
jgi:hypothetical protein